MIQHITRQAWFDCRECGEVWDSWDETPDTYIIEFAREKGWSYSKVKGFICPACKEAKR